jgi:hypothetical protein
VHPALDDWPGVDAVGKPQGNFRCFDFESNAVSEYAAVLEFFTARGFTAACGPTPADTSADHARIPPRGVLAPRQRRTLSAA